MTEPRLHQKVCFLIGVKYPTYLYFLDPGLGKSKVALDVFRYKRWIDAAHRMLVLIPNTGNIQGWRDQVKIHAHDLKINGIDQLARADREREFYDDSADVVAMTYAGFLSFICEQKVDSDGEETKGWQISEKMCAQICKRFDFVVPDECTAFRNPNSLIFRAMKRLAKVAPERYGLTGTPFGKKPEALWSQFFFIDKGETLGESLGIFRAAFFIEKQNYWSGWPDYVFDKKKTELLNTVIRNRSIRYTKEECLDLPPTISIVRNVVFNSETTKYYDKLIEDLKNSEGNFRALDSVFMQLRSLTAGYLGYKDPVGEVCQIKFPKNPKLDDLCEYLEEIDPERKCLIFNEYHVTGDIICERLKAEKVKHLRLYGKTKNKKAVIQKFQEDPSVRCLVCSSAGAMGLNLQMANYVLFYEPPTDPIIRQQEIARCERMGQQRTTFIVDFIVKNSIDEKIHKSVTEGIDLFKQIVNGDFSCVHNLRQS